MSTNVLASILLGVVVSAVAWSLSTFLSKIVFATPMYAPLFRLTSIGLGLSIPLETFYCCLRTFNESGLYSATSVIRLIIAAVLNVTFLTGFHMGVASMLWSSIISQVLLILGLGVHLSRRIPVRFDPGSFWKQAKYTAPLAFGGIGEFILNYGDRYFLRSAVSLSAIGVYSLAYKIGMLVPIVQTPFQLYWGSQEVEIVRREGGWHVFTRVGTYMMLGLTAVAVAIGLWIHPLLRVIVSPGFREAASYAGWIALAYLIRAAGGFCREIFIIEKRPDLEAVVSWSGTITVLAGYAILIPRLGVWGAVWATLAGFGLQFFIAYFVTQSVRHVDYEFGRLAKIAFWSGLVIGIHAILPPAGFWFQCAAATALSLLYVALLLINVVKPSERDYLMMIWSRYTSLRAH